MIPNKIDEVVLFQALQGELSARASARAAVNTAHIQTIVIFAGGYVVAKANGAVLGWMPYALSTMIPLISFYFISLYRHNDLQIGLLNRSLRKLEEKSTIEPELRFFQKGSYSGTNSYKARKLSQFAVMALAFASPALIFIEECFTFFLSRQVPVSVDGRAVFALMVSALLSAINLWTLMDLDRRRQEFIES